MARTLLKFAQDRDAYRAKLREHALRWKVAMLDYCITSNHVHLLLDPAQPGSVSGLMREVAGEFAIAYNRRKQRSNAFWGDNYHATVVEDGRYLWECLCYIELNMARCGVVGHPREWGWLGYQEIMGTRQRYRVLDLERLCWRLRARGVEEVQRNLDQSLREQLAREAFKRESCWTESLAVGSRVFLEELQPRVKSRLETEIVEVTDQTWALKEAATPYGQKTGLKIAAKA